MQLEECANVLASMINRLEPLHVLDYGCGQDLPLASALKDAGVVCAFKYQAYDKDVPKYASMPFPADVVACTTLLGTLNDKEAEAALDDLHRVTDCVGFFVIKASQRPAEWWLPRIMVRFDLQTFQVVEGDSFYVVVYSHKGVIENVEGEKLA